MVTASFSRVSLGRRTLIGATMRLLGWLLALLAVGGTRTSAEGNCIFRFVEQPVVDAECDIYDAVRVELTCTVSSQGFVLPVAVDVLAPDEVPIRWYYNNGTEYQLTEGINVTRMEGGNTRPFHISSSLRISATPATVPNSVTIAEGSYYCRVELSESSVESNSSQQFTVPSRTSDAYVKHLMQGTSCSGRTFVSEERTCAVHSVTVDSTTSPESSISTTLPDTTASSTNGEPTISAGTTLDNENQSTEPSDQPSPNENGGGTLQVWIYVLVAVAAVFAMIIIILAIMCMGLCLRRSQTMDANSLKQKENGGMQGNFVLSHSSSMVNNEMYRGAANEETDFTGTHGTHFTSHSQISDDKYNTLGERDYEIIKVKPSCDTCDDTHDYHHLQRPSPPAVHCSGRNAMFGFSPPNGEFRSMSTLASMNGMSTCSFSHQKSVSKQGYSTLPLPSCRDPPPPYNGNVDSHVYRELENPAMTLPGGHFLNGGAIYRSPTSSSPPDSAKYFEHFDSNTIELIPPLPARGTNGGQQKTLDSSLNESLYNPCLGGATGQQPHPLEKIPEMGAAFPEPPNPTAFPVNEYEYIPTMTDYEKPVASKGKQPKKVGENPKTRVSTKSMNYETDPNLELRANDTIDCTADPSTGESITGFKLSLADSTVDDSSDFTGASDMHFPIGLKQNGTTLSNKLSLADYRSTGGYGISTVSAEDRGASEGNVPSSTGTSNMLDDLTESKKNFQVNGMCYRDDRRSQSRERRSTSRERWSFSRETPSSQESTNEHCDVGIPSCIVTGSKLDTPPLPSTIPQSRPNPCRELDTSSLKMHMDYHKLRMVPGTVV